MIECIREFREGGIAASVGDRIALLESVEAHLVESWPAAWRKVLPTDPVEIETEIEEEDAEADDVAPVAPRKDKMVKRRKK